MEITKTTIKIEITHDWLCRQNSSLFFLQIHQICCVTIFVTNEVRLNVATFCSRDFDFIFDNFMKSACYVQKAFLKSFILTRKHLLGHQMHLLCHKFSIWFSCRWNSFSHCKNRGVQTKQLEWITPLGSTKQITLKN